MVARYGTEGTRYLLLTKGAFGEDSDISWAKMDAHYNAALANGLGNLVSRVITLAPRDLAVPDVAPHAAALAEQLQSDVERMAFRDALAQVWQVVTAANKTLEARKPWVLRKEDTAAFAAVMTTLLGEVALLAHVLAPFLPTTAARITQMLRTRERAILFPRVED